ncbi:MAG: ABC transporter permease [Gemmatimonadaceae bacterium]|nr:ABC transporter permease [Gemmatimonadaceae bacterium]
MRALEMAIAWRYLRSRRGSRLLSFISVISIAGVVVGVSALIIIMGVMNGLQTDIREKILVGSPDVRVLPYGADMRLSEWQPVLEQVRKAPGVMQAAPFVQTQGLVSNLRGYPTGAQIVGLAPVSDGEITAIRRHAILGEFAFRREGVSLPAVVLGKLLASKLSAFPGDTVVFYGVGTLGMNAATGMMVPGYDSLVVAGLFETGMYDYDDGWAYVALETAQRIAGIDRDVTGIEVRTLDRNAAPMVADTLRATLTAPVRAVSWQEHNRSFFQALSLEKLGMGFILLLIFVVAAFNIVSTLTMVVSDKTREIGILRAMGLPARSIRRVFLYQGMVIGAVGTTAGLLLGVFLAYLLEAKRLIQLDPSVYLIDHLPVRLESADMLLIVVVSMTVSTLATLYPASQAARLYPVEAIRHE